MSKLLIGADPELFIRNMKTKAPMSIIGRLGGTKDLGRRISRQGHSVLEDNCAAEFNIPPAEDFEMFKKSIKKCISFINKEVQQYDAEVTQEASLSMPIKELENPAAWVFGCEPDFNAYTGEQNLKSSADDPTLRSAGGHIHVGFKANASKEEQENVIRCMDMFVGLVSTIADKDTRRKLLYGKSGAYRPKPVYGVEYRTPSNFWIWDDEVMKLVFNNTKLAVAYAEDHFLAPDSHTCQSIRQAIDNSDVVLARQLVRHHNVPLAI